MLGVPVMYLAKSGALNEESLVGFPQLSMTHRKQLPLKAVDIKKWLACPELSHKNGNKCVIQKSTNNSRKNLHMHRISLSVTRYPNGFH